MNMFGKKSFSNPEPKKPRYGKGKQKAKYNVFTTQQKLDILDEIDRKESTVGAILKKHNVPRNMLTGWRKNREALAKQVEEGHSKKQRLVLNNGLKRIKDGIRAFYDLNSSMPKGLKIPITRESTLIFSTPLHAALLHKFILLTRICHFFKSHLNQNQTARDSQ